MAERFGWVSGAASDRWTNPAKNRQRARPGKHFGTRRCFGYEPDGHTIREGEADAIRTGMEAVLNGASLNEVGRRWNALGLYGPQGKMKLPADVTERWEQEIAEALEKGEPRPRRPYVPVPWKSPVVSRTLRTPRLAGLKSYHGEIVRDQKTGEPVNAEWPGIVDVDTCRAVQNVLTDPARAVPFPSAERQLLSGLAVCADCGAPIQSGGTRNGKRRYRCSSKSGHFYREAAAIDEYAELRVMIRLSKGDPASLLSPSTDVDVKAIRASLRKVDRRQKAMAEAFADGAVNMSQLTVAKARLKEQEAALVAKLPQPTNPAMRSLTGASDLTAARIALSQDAKRAVIAKMATVEILAPGTKENAYVDWRLRVINSDTMRMTWRTETPPTQQ